MNKLIFALDAIAEWTGRSVAWLTYGMMFATLLVVILRYGFSISITALNESVAYQFALIFMLGAAYTLKHDDHVRVDVFYRKLAPQAQAWVNLSGTLLLLFPVMGMIFWLSSDYVLASWSLREGSRESAGLPLVYLLKSLLWLMPGLLILQGMADLLRAIAVIRKAAPAAASLRTEV